MIWYSIGDEDINPQHRSMYALTSYPQLTVERGEDLEHDAETYAEHCADDYHANHDGWASKWPVTINLHTEESGPVVARVKVESKMAPTFSAGPVEIVNADEEPRP